jgi:hypothetical protein
VWDWNKEWLCGAGIRSGAGMSSVIGMRSGIVELVKEWGWFVRHLAEQKS